VSPQDELERAFIETKERMIPDAVEQTAKRTSHEAAPGSAAQEAGKADAASTDVPDEALSKQFSALGVSEDQRPQTEPLAPSASPQASQPENDAASSVPDTQDEKPHDKTSPTDSSTKL